MSDSEYVHGYSSREHLRLHDQAATLTELLHGDTYYPPGSAVLEAGCGVGAQTVILARTSPDARFTSVDISAESLSRAKSLIDSQGITNVAFQQEDIYNLSFEESSFDHVFVCFVLEHLREPVAALKSLKKALKPGGSLTVIEGDHGSAYFYPESEEAHAAIKCLIDLQARMGGDSLIGRRLYPLLIASGLSRVRVSPRMVYVDSGRPSLVEGFTKNTFTAMVEGVREQALQLGLIDEAVWDKGIASLNRTTEADGTFCYTFFKGIAAKD